MIDTLPAVPVLDAAPASNAASILAAATGDGTPRLKRPPGSWFRKRATARERGLADPPLPPGTALYVRRDGTAKSAPEISVPPLFPEPTPPPTPKPEPTPTPPAEPPPARLTADDVRQERAAIAEEATAAAKIEERHEIILDRATLERRTGKMGELGFRLVGIALGDEEAIALTEIQRDELAALFVEAWPEECAAMLQGGGMTKVLAVGSLAQVVRSKWTTYRARRQARKPDERTASGPPAPAATKAAARFTIPPE